MDATKEVKIKELATELFKLERTFTAMGFQNIPEEFEKAKIQKVEYELYQAKVWEAKEKLRRVVESV